MSMNQQRDCLIYLDGRRIDVSEIIAIGLDGVVLKSGNLLLKVPKLYGRISADGTITVPGGLLTDSLQNERAIYQHLSGMPGLARLHSWTGTGLLLEYYENGSLEQHILEHDHPDSSLQNRWICEIVDIVCQCHQRKVLIFDIALRNFVLAHDQSVRIIDFANSLLVTQDQEMQELATNDCTIKLDLLHLANVIYSIATWRKFEVQCCSEEEWPDVAKIPELEECPWRDVVRRSWTREYKLAKDLAKDVHSLIL